MLFSERYGYTKPREALQIESIDEPLRNRLWNEMKSFYILFLRFGGFEKFVYTLWIDFFKSTNEDIPGVGADVHPRPGIDGELVFRVLKNHIQKAEWHQVYNLIEFSFCTPINNEDKFDVEFENAKSEIISEINKIFEKEKAGYRLINGKITPITNEAEIQGIEEAINSTENNILKSVNTHLKAGLTKLSDRQNPDYRNSIKESISAVEALVNIINGDTKGTLGTSIKKLKTKINIHPALESGFNSIYGYTSDADGIRHPLKDNDTCDFDDAKYMMVSCSAFINYLIGKASKAGILTT